MRTAKYYLENGLGTRLPLNVGGEYFIYHVEGLGLTASDSFANIDKGFFPISKNGFKTEKIVGDICFLEKAFENYQTIVDFMENSEELFFIYAPISEEYHRKVSLTSVKKGKRNGVGIAEAEVQFTCLTPWFKSTPLKLNIEDASSLTPFQWDVTSYDGTAVYAGGSITNYSATFSADGHLDAPISIVWSGIATKPKFILTDDVGNEIGRCEVDYNLVAGDVLKLSTDYLDSYCKLERGGTVIDMMPFINLSYEPFFRIPPNKEVTLRINATSLSGSAEAFVHSYYRSI